MSPSPLLAYIDPMSGTIVLQVILAAGLGCLAFFRRSLKRLVGWVPGKKNNSQTPVG